MWTLTVKLKFVQRAIERAILHVSLTKVSTPGMRWETKLIDIAFHITKLKWPSLPVDWQYKICSTDNNWFRRVLNRRPRLGKRSVGRPQSKCSDNLSRTASRSFIREA